MKFYVLLETLSNIETRGATMAFSTAPHHHATSCPGSRSALAERGDPLLREKRQWGQGPFQESVPPLHLGSCSCQCVDHRELHAVPAHP